MRSSKGTGVRPLGQLWSHPGHMWLGWIQDQNATAAHRGAALRLLPQVSKGSHSWTRVFTTGGGGGGYLQQMSCSGPWGLGRAPVHLPGVRPSAQGRLLHCHPSASPIPPTQHKGRCWRGPCTRRGMLSWAVHYCLPTKLD